MRSIFLLLSAFLTIAANGQSLTAFVSTPLCLGDALRLSFPGTPTDTYYWTGPNGFASTQQTTFRQSMTYADTGVYRVVRNGVDTFYTQPVRLLPALTLTGVTASQVIPFGGSIQLNAAGAEYYVWLPDERTLSNPNINNPLATPLTNTIYKVVGLNAFGCRDSAQVNIEIASPEPFFIPTAFTPDNDGKNDVFRIVNPRNYTLVDFVIQNRWGQVVYNNTNDIRFGWDGTFNGIPQDMGYYNYSIIISGPHGEKKNFTGTVVLIR